MGFCPSDDISLFCLCTCTGYVYILVWEEPEKENVELFEARTRHRSELGRRWQMIITLLASLWCTVIVSALVYIIEIENLMGLLITIIGVLLWFITAGSFNYDHLVRSRKMDRPHFHGKGWYFFTPAEKIAVLYMLIQ